MCLLVWDIFGLVGEHTLLEKYLVVMSKLLIMSILLSKRTDRVCKWLEYSSSFIHLPIDFIVFHISVNFFQSPK